MACICFPQRYVQCHLWSWTISAKWRLKHFMNIYWYNSIPVLKNGIRNTVFYSVTNRKRVYFLKWDGSIWDLRGISKQKWIHLFWAFWSFKLSLKEETMKNIFNQNVAELAHYIIGFYKQGLGTCFGVTGILV